MFQAVNVNLKRPRMFTFVCVVSEQKIKEQAVVREKQGYQKRVSDKEYDLERKRHGALNIRNNQRQFLQYKALSQQ